MLGLFRKFTVLFLTIVLVAVSSMAQGQRFSAACDPGMLANLQEILDKAGTDSVRKVNQYQAQKSLDEKRQIFEHAFGSKPVFDPVLPIIQQLVADSCPERLRPRAPPLSA